jgi:single-strand DNA-binding protein
MNSVILIGRLTRDPELRYSPNTQTAVAHFTLAVDRQRGQNGESQADFIRITVFGKQAETVERYLKKGSQAAVNGRIQTGSYTKDGQTIYTTDVIANRVEFLGSRNSGSNDNSYQRSPQTDNSQQGPFGGQDDFPDAFQAADDDIPF